MGFLFLENKTMNENNNHNKKEKIGVVTFLSRSQVDYLDHMGKDALFLNGKKLSRSQILANLVDMLVKSNISIEQLELNGEELSSQFLKALSRAQVTEA